MRNRWGGLWLSCSSVAVPPNSGPWTIIDIIEIYRNLSCCRHLKDGNWNFSWSSLFPLQNLPSMFSKIIYSWSDQEMCVSFKDSTVQLCPSGFLEICILTYWVCTDEPHFRIQGSQVVSCIRTCPHCCALGLTLREFSSCHRYEVITS